MMDISVQESDVEHWRFSTWRINLNLDTPNLLPSALQWTILDNDAVPGFEARAKRMQDCHRKQLEKMENEDQKQLARSSQMTVSWDKGFKDVTGDKVYLLTSAPNISHVFSSNGPGDKKWIVTKIVQIKGKPTCWCLPIEVKTGEEIKVKLTEDNTFALEAVFDKTMHEPDQKE